MKQRFNSKKLADHGNAATEALTQRVHGGTPASPAIQPLLSRRDVARMFGCHPETIKRYEKRGMLQAIKINSRLTRYEAGSVYKLIADARIKAEA
jgi:hypothetical protein